MVFDGKEIEGKLGDVVSYGLDITGDVHVVGDAALNLDFKKDLVADMPGALEVEAVGSVQLKLRADPVVLALPQLKKLGKVGEFLADQIAKLRAGTEVHPVVLAAAEEHAVAVSEPKA